MLRQTAGPAPGKDTHPLDSSPTALGWLPALWTGAGGLMILHYALLGEVRAH